MHVDEDLAQPPVIVLAGAQVDLVAAHHRLLGVTLAAMGHLLARADALDPLDHPLDDLLRHLRGLGGRGRRDQGLDGVLGIVLLVGDERRFRGCESFEPSR